MALVHYSVDHCNKSRTLIGVVRALVHAVLFSVIVTSVSVGPSRHNMFGFGYNNCPAHETLLFTFLTEIYYKLLIAVKNDGFSLIPSHLVLNSLKIYTCGVISQPSSVLYGWNEASFDTHMSNIYWGMPWYIEFVGNSSTGTWGGNMLDHVIFLPVPFSSNALRESSIKGSMVFSN